MSSNREQADLIAVAMPLYGHAALALEAIESVLASNLGNCRSSSSSRSTAIRGTRRSISCCSTPRPIRPSMSCSAGMPARAVLAIVPSTSSSSTFPRRRPSISSMPTTASFPAPSRRFTGSSSSSGCGWVYTNIDTFSVSWRAHYGNRYSRLVHCITDNICDTGSMISIDVFQAGVRFNDDRQNGFEDWEFWLSCIEHGFVGTPCHDTVFEYRLRAESRFKEANRDRATSVSFLRKRHMPLFQRPMLVDFEHEECPRYLFARTEDAAISLFTDPTKPPSDASPRRHHPGLLGQYRRARQ